jgi:hypothetical protein
MALAKSPESHKDDDSDYEPIRPSKSLGRSRVPASSARSRGDAESDDEPVRPLRRLKRSRVPAKSEEDEENEDDEPIRPLKRLKRSQVLAKSAKPDEVVESQEGDPSDTEKLAPGKKYHRWSNGSLRASRTIRGNNDTDLPIHALNGPVHELESNCTHPNVDIRLCDFDLSIEEILTVRASAAPTFPLAELELTIILVFSPPH